MKKVLLACSVLLATACGNSPDQNLKLNELEYFETQGVNVLVYSNLFSGGFNDEKNSGIELIHHGVRTAQGGAIRLSNTPEQWDLVPSTPSRKVNIEDNSIEVALRYDDFDFDSRIVVTGKGKAVEISVYLDKPFHRNWKETQDSTLSSCLHNIGEKLTSWTDSPTGSHAMP